ncbi:MAG: ATP-binding protein [Brevefilum sp.]|jgi:DNA helicase HerA-like ATPase
MLDYDRSYIELGIDENSSEFVKIDATKSQRMLVCGKTGTGKSYTLGVCIEELHKLGDVISLILDPQGIFWTMAQKNSNPFEADKLWQYNLSPQEFPINLMVPGNPVERFGDEEIVVELNSRGIEVQSILINPSDLTPEMWIDLFNLDINELQGILLHKAVSNCMRSHGKDFLIDDINAEVLRLRGLDTTKEAVERKLDMARDWQIFSNTRYCEIWEILHTDKINILDLSVIAQGRYGLRNMVVAVLANFIFRKRTIARRREALGLPSDTKKVWLVVDEAHNFCPAGKSTLSKEILIRWAKEGRQPGLSLLVASQQPSAIDREILTQCGIRIVHRITSLDDFRAINALSQDFLEGGLSSQIKRLTHPGQALLIDDEKEIVISTQIRPRQSLHGGGSA